ncbi:PD-(D/E)XK nuclease family protein [uncultured Alistipes sp.]|uniref:PD-(D/E)XK nuclease family protein n=1 Tax=uncultured Alistipes sp. TaxID=538949 RepID=UPI0026326758|nr:PD-(D/E)XK nuclease family protein [uncultured Alistipes sp.]
MKGFLAEVAADLYGRYGEALSQREVLFPSRRARLFFTEALSRVAERPMWQPRWTTVDELMEEISGLRTADRLRLLTELWRVYSAFHDEPFDRFYFWGEMLLADFDTIDKYLIDARQLFRNLSEIRELEADLSYLTPRQLQIVRFWSSLGPEADLSQEKRRFLALWRSLGPIYDAYRARLTELGIAYGGMVQRAAAERIRAGGFSFAAPRRFVVAGVNALSECEKELFRLLSSAAETDFYWDYDDYYLRDREQEAGLFVRTNLAEFPPVAGAVSHDHMARSKRLVSVAAVSNAVQCKYAAEILRSLAREQGAPLDKETAVVLTDENLLLPLLHALPDELGEVNVTMGFPLRQSLAYTFVERLVELQAHRRRKGGGWTFYHADVAGLLAHPYVAGCDPELTRSLQEQIVDERRISVEAAWLARNELLAALFSAAEQWRDLSDYLLRVIEAVARRPYEGDDAGERVEFLAVLSDQIVKLRNSLDGCDVDLSTEVYASLLRRHLQTLRIPFEGEPLEGVQVMGILETRNLDFRHVVLLSMTDDNFPGNRLAQASFVPYNLRAAFSLPTPEHHEGVYAYYFYRLIQRAETVHMLYCARADDKSTGEPSRYIHQLDCESGLGVHRIEAGVDVNPIPLAPIEVAKDAAVMARLGRFVDPESPATLSPTALFRYVACPLRFYFHSVARLETDDEVAEEVDAPMFGTILHAAAQRLYARVEGEAHPAKTLRALLSTDAVDRAVGEAINEHWLRDERASEADYTGNLLLVREIVVRYLRGGVVPYDAAHDAFAVRGLEREVAYAFPFRCGGRELRVKFSGIADRIDSLDDGTLRVVDYKTGAPHLEFAGLESLFTGEGRHRLSNILQTLLYSMMLHRSEGRDVVPALYYVRAMHRPDYAPQLDDRGDGVRGARYSFYAERFEELLRATLAELFDPAVPFRPCDDPDTCTFCDFNLLCRRGAK